MQAIERHASDRHIATEAGLQRFLDAEPDQVSEIRRAEVPPAATDEEKEKRQRQDDCADQPAEASPHRATPLPLPRRSVMMLFGRVVVYIHLVRALSVLTTSQKIEIAQVITGRE